MPLSISRWERRDNSDRDAFARAALDLCRAWRAEDGVRGARFYWASADTLVTMLDAESPEVFDRQPNAMRGRALFALSDLARNLGNERWGDARTGEEAFHIAGR